MYMFLLRFMKPFPAGLLTAFWYAGLMLAIFLVSHHAGKGDFIYLHL